MSQDNRLIRKMFNGILIGNAISMVAGVACVLIDAIVTGQFLGTDAVAATGLIQPVVMLLNLVGTLLVSGLGSVCTKYMGKAQPDRVNQVYSIVTITAIAVTALLVVALYLSAPWLGRFLGGSTGNDAIVAMISDYLKGFSFGLIPMRITILLTGIMVLDNDKNRSIIAMGAILLSDTIFDLLNAVIFHGGMYGMAIATSLSSFVGFAVIMTHFLRKNRVIHFTVKGLRFRDMAEVLLRGIPLSICMGSQSLKTLFFNSLLLAVASSNAVAALSVCNSAFSVVNAGLLGFFTASAVLSSLLFGEEDRTGMEQGLFIAIKNTMTVMAVIAILLVIFPQPVARIFIQSSDPQVVVQGGRFIRFMAIQFLLMAISYPISGAYQGIGNLKLNYFIDSMREGILPIASVMICGNLMGIRGMEIGFVIAGVLTLVLCFLLPWKHNGRLPKSCKELLIYPREFGVVADEVYESHIHDIDEVMSASEEVYDFCLQGGTDSRTAMYLSLFVEEMCTNTVTHGFDKDKNGTIDLRLICKDDMLILRLRDDGKPFDPVEWLNRNSNENPASGMGIRVVVALADRVDYIPAMELNNLVITKHWKENV